VCDDCFGKMFPPESDPRNPVEALDADRNQGERNYIPPTPYRDGQRKVLRSAMEDSSQLPLKVLLLEDETSDCCLFATAVEETGLNIRLVKTVSGGQGGIEYLTGKGRFKNRQENPLPYVIALDLRMGDVSGVEFIEWCHKTDICSRMAVVVLTGAHPDDPEVKKAIRSGVKQLIFKPTTLAGWRDVVRKIYEIGCEHRDGDGHRLAQAA